jgi:hypothetical protein
MDMARDDPGFRIEEIRKIPEPRANFVGAVHSDKTQAEPYDIQFVPDKSRGKEKIHGPYYIGFADLYNFRVEFFDIHFGMWLNAIMNGTSVVGYIALLMICGSILGGEDRVNL